MRTFIAIELPKEIKDALAALQNELKKTGADVKWVEPSNIHLTLKFLGEVEESRLNKINSIIEKIAQDFTAFRIHMNSLGAFPTMRHPRVIWAGMDKGDIESKKIALELEERMEKIGIPRENRAFSSHITIGRVRTPAKLDELTKTMNALADGFQKIDFEFSVTKITLFKSTLSPKGPTYEPLTIASLKTA